MRTIRKNARLILVSGCIAGLAFVVYCAALVGSAVQSTNDRDNRDIRKQKEMVRIALEVGDLAPIPKGAKIRVANTEGNMFTRSFRVSFSADAHAIRKWLSASRGAGTAKVVKTSNTTKYILNAGHGFQYAEVMVDLGTDTVSTYVARS